MEKNIKQKLNSLIILALILMLIWGGIFMFINPDIAKLISYSGSIVSLLLGLNEIRHILRYI